MKILVANLGSTSFKYSLYDMETETLLARGKVQRIGDAESPCEVTIGGKTATVTVPVPDHAVAVRQCLAQLTDPESGCLKSADEVAGIGFKAVMANNITGVQWVTKELLDAIGAQPGDAGAQSPVCAGDASAQRAVPRHSVGGGV